MGRVRCLHLYSLKPSVLLYGSCGLRDGGLLARTRDLVVSVQLHFEYCGLASPATTPQPLIVCTHSGLHPLWSAPFCRICTLFPWATCVCTLPGLSSLVPRSLLVFQCLHTEEMFFSACNMKNWGWPWDEKLRVAYLAVIHVCVHKEYGLLCACVGFC